MVKKSLMHFFFELWILNLLLGDTAKPKFPLESFPDAFCLDLFRKLLPMVGM